MDEALSYSRPQASAERLGDAAPDRQRFISKQVLLTAEAQALTTENGRECFLAGLRLLPRICANVDVALPLLSSSVFYDECQRVAASIAIGRPVKFLSAVPAKPLHDAILSVGTRTRPDLPWTVINAHGWLARVSSGSYDLPCACTAANPLAALAAACLGVSDVFKHLLRLRPDRGAFFDSLSFSLFSYECNAEDPGPPIPSEISLELGIVGAGAIGNGIAYGLRRLPIRGRTWIVDPQRFGQENRGTCVLMGPDDVGQPKATKVAEVLRGRIAATPFVDTFQQFSTRINREAWWPSVIVCGVDNPEARHAVQDIWPDVLIDGAIGDFGCQVSRHPWGPDTACVRCLFAGSAQEPAEVLAGRISGLHPARIALGEEVVTDHDVTFALPEKQSWLRKQVGRRICSVVSDAMIAHLSQETQRAGFAPSVPFVAALSGAMVVGELVKHAARWSTPLDPRYQLDLLWGPTRGQLLPQSRRVDCLCVTRQSNIEAFRRSKGRDRIDSPSH